jgi:hypothetical protein
MGGQQAVTGGAAAPALEKGGPSVPTQTSEPAAQPAERPEQGA